MVIRPNFWGTFDFSHSWAATYDYWQFLNNDWPGGWQEGTAPGSSTNYWDPNAVVTGDVLFYDWGQNEGISHAAIQTGWGTDPYTGWNGNFVDAHSVNHYHAFWSLRPWNPDWPTTTIHFMHIDAGNY